MTDIDHNDRDMWVAEAERLTEENDRLRGRILKLESTGAVNAVARPLKAEVERLREEQQAVLNCINLYGDDVLHSALDAIGWFPRGPTEENRATGP